MPWGSVQFHFSPRSCAPLPYQPPDRKSDLMGRGNGCLQAKARRLSSVSILGYLVKSLGSAMCQEVTNNLLLAERVLINRALKS